MALSGSLFLGDWSGTDAPGLGIETKEDIAQAAETLRGAPVTVEHEGTYEAVAELDGQGKGADLSGVEMHRHLSGSGDPRKRPVGTVLHAEGTMALIHIEEKAGRIANMVKNGMLGLSLTHLEETPRNLDPPRGGIDRGHGSGPSQKMSPGAGVAGESLPVVAAGASGTLAASGTQGVQGTQGTSGMKGNGIQGLGMESGKKEGQGRQAEGKGRTKGKRVKSLELSLVVTPARSRASVLQEYKGQAIGDFKTVLSSKMSGQPQTGSQMETTSTHIDSTNSAAQGAAQVALMETDAQAAPVAAATGATTAQAQAQVAAAGAAQAPVAGGQNPPEAAAGSQNPLEAAWAAIPEAHRETIKQKLLQMQTNVDTAVEAEKKAREEADVQRKLVEDFQTDATREKELFEQRVAALAEELRANHPGAADMIEGCRTVAGQHPAAQMAVDRMVRACNIVFAENAMTLGGPGRKRARTVAGVGAQQAPVQQAHASSGAAAPAPTPAAPQAAAPPLAQVARPTIHASPGDAKLRNILSSFDAF
ncbi:MAG: hypothetical protein ACPH2J_08285 [Akkermansiaceae bacterium]